MKKTLLPTSAFLPSLPVRLPEHEPRESSTNPSNHLSDKQPENAEGQWSSEIYPFPVNNVMKWLTLREMEAELVASGYDSDLISLYGLFYKLSYDRLKPYYMQKEQERRNKKKELARKIAESLVGSQTPPSEETPPPQE